MTTMIQEGRKLYSHNVQMTIELYLFFPMQFFYCFFNILGVRYLWQYYCCRSFSAVAKQRCVLNVSFKSMTSCALLDHARMGLNGFNPRSFLSKTNWKTG